MLKETVTITLSLLVAFVASIPIADRAEKRTPTLLVSLDGLQATKLDEFLRNNPDSYMNRFFVDRGVKADYMAASFPTLTFPNHFTLVTGLYQESHGIVGNTLFDPKIDKRVNFLSDSYANDEMWWDQAEPIWLSAKRQVHLSFFCLFNHFKIIIFIYIFFRDLKLPRFSGPAVKFGDDIPMFSLATARH